MHPSAAARPTRLRPLLPALAAAALAWAAALSARAEASGPASPPPVATIAEVGSAAAPAPAEGPDRLAWLRREVARHESLYRVLNTPEISDQAFDELVREMRALEQRHPEWLADSGPAPVLGDDRQPGYARIGHLHPVTSLEKVDDWPAVLDWWEQRARTLGSPLLPVLLEPKYDGLALNLTYHDRAFISAATRGDGRQGDDVTEAVRGLAVVPSGLPPAAPSGTLEIRGELHQTWADFHRLNEAREDLELDPFAHPRGVAAGAVRRRRDSAEPRPELRFVAFALGAGRDEAPPDQAGLYRHLASWGFSIPEFRTAADAAALQRTWEEMRAARPAWEFPTDGLVVKIADRAAQERLGEGAEGPRWALAWKFRGPPATTRVRAITLAVGRTGVLVPVAEVEPIRLGGREISRVHLHHLGWIREHDLRPGDTVELELRGEVIPQISRILPDQRSGEAPPYSVEEAIRALGWPAAPDARGQWRMTDPTHPAWIAPRLVHYASRGAMDLSGLGPETLGAAARSGQIRHPLDLYALDQAGWQSVAGLSEESAAQAVAALAQSRRQPFHRLLVGLGIPGVGPAAAGRLARLHPTPADLATASPEQVEEMPDLGRLAREGLRQWLAGEGPDILRRCQQLGLGGGAD